MTRMDTGHELPRVLLLSSEAPHTGAAGAIVLYRLFRDYPATRLLVVSNSVLPEDGARLACGYQHVPLLADRLSRTRFWPWRAILRTLGASSLVGLGRIERALSGYEPEVVVTLMQDSWYYDLARRYATAHRLPLVLLAHDVAHGFEPVPEWLRARQLLRDGVVYRNAAERLCVSDGMAKHYLEEFGVGAEILLPPRSDCLPVQSPQACRQLKRAGRLTLGYAGGFHYGYGEQLLNMLPLLRESGTVVELFGPIPGGSVASLRDATDVLHFNGYAATPEEAWSRLLQKCDALLQPYLDPPAGHEFQYRTHFPSKLGDCLSLGLPLLITGPEFASGVAWCRRRSSIALWPADHSEASLRVALERLRTDANLRITLATNAQAAGSEFDAAALRAQFTAAIVRASRQGSPARSPRR